jgi:hypothetical protein
MEQHDAQTEDDQRPRLEQNAVAGDPSGAFGRPGLHLQVSRPVVIDGLGGNGQHRNRRQHGKNRHQQEHGALRERIADRARHQGDRDIAGMIKGRIPSHSARQ